MGKCVRVIDMDDPQETWDQLYEDVRAGLMIDPPKEPEPPAPTVPSIFARLMGQGEQ